VRPKEGSLLNKTTELEKESGGGALWRGREFGVVAGDCQGGRGTSPPWSGKGGTKFPPELQFVGQIAKRKNGAGKNLEGEGVNNWGKNFDTCVAFHTYTRIPARRTGKKRVREKKNEAAVGKGWTARWRITIQFESGGGGPGRKGNHKDSSMKKKGR